jgi:protein phosphatase
LKPNEAFQSPDPLAWNDKQTRLTTSGFDFAARSHRGWLRKNNQDRYVIHPLEDGSVLLAVADGLGHGKGAGLAADFLRQALERIAAIPSGEERRTLLELAKTLDGQIRDRAEKTTDLNGMGSTLVAVLIRDRTAWWVHIGDSRLYRYRNNRLAQITEDQTLSRYLVEEGELTPEQVPVHYSRMVLDQYVGCGYCAPETGSFAIRPDDWLMIISDGVYRHLESREMSSVLNRTGNIEEKVEHLVQAVLTRGGKDNLTVLMAHTLIQPPFEHMKKGDFHDNKFSKRHQQPG